MSDIGDSVNLDARARVRPLIAVRPGQRRPQVAQGPGDPCGRRRGGPRGRRVLRSEGTGRARSCATCSPTSPPPALVAIRVNGVDTAFFAGDLALVEELRPDVLVLPKATPEAVDALGEDGPPVVAIVETADGLRQAYEVASQPRVQALIVGAIDLGVELRLEQRAGRARDPVRALEGGVRFGGGASSGSHRPGVDRRAGQRRARGGRALRTIPGLPRQSLHTPGSGGDREPRLHAQRRGAHESTPRGRGLRACSAAREKV